MKLVVVYIAAAAAFPLSAHDVFSTKITWSREISRVIYQHCAGCHHEGGSAFSLTSFAAARPWATAIKEEVLARRMPPFGAIKGFGDLENDHALTQEQLHLISDWVEGGAPEGDPALLPKDPKFGPLDTPRPKTGSELIVDGSFTLPHELTAVAVRPKSLTEGSSVKVIVQLPDGAIEPLIWLYHYKAEFDRTYYFRKPLRLPAGTRIECFPASAGTISLMAQR